MGRASEYAGRNKEFAAWLEEVDILVQRAILLSVFDLEDVEFYSSFAADEEPLDFVREVVAPSVADNYGDEYAALLTDLPTSKRDQVRFKDREVRLRLSTLYHKGKKDKIYSWRCWTDGATIMTEYGEIDGKKQLALKKAKPKNVGRANETTAEEQAILEAKSMWQNKLDRKYRRTVEKAMEPLPLPMLAKKFADREKYVVYPVHVQPKLDGIRCLAQWWEGKLELTSRSGKPLNCPHIIAELEALRPQRTNIVLDGELYVHGESFQTITSWVKKIRPEAENVKLHVYDILSMEAGDLEFPWRDRYDMLEHFFEGEDFKHIVKVPTFAVSTREGVVNFHDEFVKQGYEGAIVRLLHGKYLFGYRSDELLKVKIFQDGEFRVIGWRPGVGKFKDVPVFRCVMDNDIEFDVAPKGTKAQRKKMLDEADSCIGKWLKVKYFGLYDSGCVRFPVGLGFRMEEDMDND